jgi:hypothetical protein
MNEFLGMPVKVLPKERYKYRPRTGECFHFEFAFLTDSVDFRTRRHIPDPRYPTVRVHEIWSKV